MFQYTQRDRYGSGRIIGHQYERSWLNQNAPLQIALGFQWHWPGDRTADESQLTDLAMDAIRAGHLEVEDHHPEFESANADRVDVHKLLTDRVCVHLQKDPKDTKNGWDVNLNFIGTIYWEEWFRFAEQHKDICFYAALEQTRAEAKIDFVNNRRMRLRTRRARTIHCCCWCQQRVWASSRLMGSYGIAPSFDGWYIGSTTRARGKRITDARRWGCGVWANSICLPWLIVFKTDLCYIYAIISRTRDSGCQRAKG